jgi:hypothetical protein
MKALTITQPWATLIAVGAKRIEMRSWPTKYRGPIAIHSSKAFPKDCFRLCRTEPFLSILIKCGLNKEADLPLGSIIATANLVECIQTELMPKNILYPPVVAMTAHEYDFGDFGPGRYGWILDNVRALKTPIPCKGSLGLWTVPEAIALEVSNAL